MKFESICRVKGHTALHQTAGLHNKSVIQLIAALVENETGALARRLITVFALVVLAVPARAATWYVDSSVASSGDGTSWPSAWKNVSNISGLSAGDTVYFSGGPSGSSQTYSITGNWSPSGGSSGNPIIYATGQDPQYNGTVIFNGNGTWAFFSPASYVTFNGNVNGARNMIFTNANAATLANYTVIVNETSSTMYNQTFRYVQFYGAVYITPCNGTEFDHCKFNAVNWNNRDLFLQGDGSQNSATEGLVHDSEIWVVKDVGEWTGDDGIAGGNITISNCFLGTVPIAANSYIGQGSQHQDLIQGAYGQIHVFNSWFQDSKQYGFYGEYRFQGGSYWVINCVFVNIAAYAVAIGPDSPNFTLPNNIVANNLCIDGADLGVNNGASYSGINYEGSIVVNNNSVNASSRDLSGTGLIVANNLTGFPTSGFVSYSQSLDTSGQGTNNNFHLNSTAITAIGQGTNLSSDFTFDRDGNPRPSAGAWDIGPYVYGSISTNPVISVQPSPRLNFGSVLTNTTEDLAFTVQNSGGGTLSGTASVSPPFSIVAGGTYRLVAGQSTNVTIRFSATAVGAFTNTVTFTVTGGNGTTRTASGTGAANYSAPIVAGSLTFQPSDGNLSGPFVLSSGYVSQSVTTGTNGGQLVYLFQTTNSGLFAVEALVNAPNSGANSFYVNIDAPPTDPTNIWDLTLTTGFTNEIVTWRGNGTNDQMSIYPQQNFSLNAGLHQLIIEGREAGAELGPVTIVQLQPPPPPPFVMP